MKYLIGFLVALGLLSMGCVNTPPGGDRDSHGCIPSAGYTWCDATQQCIRPWEQNCTAVLDGNDSDSHGCIGTAGYVWCDALQKCIRPWEENCTAMLVGNDSDEHGCKASAGYTWCAAKSKCIRVWEENCTNSVLEPEAREFCGDENISAVYVCGEYIRTVSSLMGGGSTFYTNGTKVVQCPVVGPDSMSDQCKQLLLGNNCVEQQVC